MFFDFAPVLFFNEVSHFCVSRRSCSISSELFFQFRCIARRFLSLLVVSCALRPRSTFLLDNAITVRMSSILTTPKKLLYSLWSDSRGRNTCDTCKRSWRMDSRAAVTWQRIRCAIIDLLTCAVSGKKKSLFFCPDCFLRNKLRSCFSVAMLR